MRKFLYMFAAAVAFLMLAGWAENTLVAQDDDYPVANVTLESFDNQDALGALARHYAVHDPIRTRELHIVNDDGDVVFAILQVDGAVHLTFLNEGQSVQQARMDIASGNVHVRTP